MDGIRLLQTTPRIIIGPGSLGRIGEEVKRLGASRVMIVTDRGLVETGIVARVEELIRSIPASVNRFDAVEADPRYEIAAQAADIAKESGADLILGIGGGSSLDIAKVAAILVTNSDPVAAYFGIDMVPKKGLPTILVPTTAGTGSEVTPIAILSDHAEKLKKGIVSPFLFPDAALLDPELTLGLPPSVTAATGMDALIHAVEAYTSKNASRMTDMFALEAMKLIFENIRTAYAERFRSNGEGSDARRKSPRGYGFCQCRSDGRSCLRVSNRRGISYSSWSSQQHDAGAGDGIQHAWQSCEIRLYGPSVWRGLTRSLSARRSQSSREGAEDPG